MAAITSKLMVQTLQSEAISRLAASLVSVIGDDAPDAGPRVVPRVR